MPNLLVLQNSANLETSTSRRLVDTFVEAYVQRHPDAAIVHRDLARNPPPHLSPSLAESREFGVIAAETWRTSDLGAKHAMIRAGLGWGSLPAHLIEPDMADGRLVALNMADIGPTRRRLVYDLVWKAGVDLGPATRWLANQLLSLTPSSA